MRHFLHDHLAFVIFVPVWTALTWVVFSCCGLR
jgi:hypothetical protein